MYHELNVKMMIHGKTIGYKRSRIASVSQHTELKKKDTGKKGDELLASEKDQRSSSLLFKGSQTGQQNRTLLSPLVSQSKTSRK